jgi:hypothetical protein
MDIDRKLVVGLLAPYVVDDDSKGRAPTVAEIATSALQDIADELELVSDAMREATEADTAAARAVYRLHLRTKALGGTIAAMGAHERRETAATVSAALANAEVSKAARAEVAHAAE